MQFFLYNEVKVVHILFISIIFEAKIVILPNAILYRVLFFTVPPSIV